MPVLILMFKGDVNNMNLTKIILHNEKLVKIKVINVKVLVVLNYMFNKLYKVLFIYKLK